MIFYDKLAKLGMTDTISCKQTSDNQLQVYIGGEQTIVKTLTQQDKDYQLSNVKKQYAYNQVVGLTPGYLLVRIDKLVSIVKEDSNGN